MWSKLNLCHKLRSKALLVGFYSGCVGVLVDLDHPIAYYIFKIQGTQWENGGGRILHLPLLIIACIVIVHCGAHIGRLFGKSILKDEI